MSGETIAATVVLIFGVVLAAEYLCLYIMAQNQEKYLKQKKTEHNEISSLFVSVLSSPTEKICENELSALFEYIKTGNSKYYDAVSTYIKYANTGDLPEKHRIRLDKIKQMLEPQKRLTALLDVVDNNEKAYIVRLISSLNLSQNIPQLKKYLNSRNKRLAYHAGMALSQLGDEESTIKFIKQCGRDHTLSSRIIMEILRNYSGDKPSLVRHIYDDVDDYMKATVIKGVKNDRLRELKDIYYLGVKSKSAEIRNACVKALSAFGDEADEHTLITALNDHDWVVRLSAIDGLEKIGSKACLNAIIAATGDDEWWIRRNAAQALIRLDPTLKNAQGVIKGYDRYAAEAVKSALGTEKG